MENIKYSADVIIPVYKPDGRLEELLSRLDRQTYPLNKIIIMNTEEAFWKPELENQYPKLSVHHLPKAEFDHGGTRSQGASYSSADILIFMTQDALPENDRLVEELIKPFRPGFTKEQERVAVVYARQLPEDNCGIVEKYTRSFNYPKDSRIKTAADLDTLGIKTFFASNVCAAYKKEYFDKMGGFIRHTIFNEDMIFAGKAVREGYAICYQADARVIHSHNYTCMQQFRRNFDLAVSQTDNPDVFEGIRSESEGIRLVKKTARYLLTIKRPWLIIDLVIKSGFKFLGYKMGRMYRKLPKRAVLFSTMNKEYWK